MIQPDAREGQAGLFGVSERLIVPSKPGNSGGGKGPQFKVDVQGGKVDVQGGESREIGVSLTPPDKVRKLREALHAKAKSAPAYRFYALYDKVYRRDVLAFAYGCCFENQGAAGVDGQTFEDIEAYGWERWVDELAEELRTQTYRPQAVRRVHLAKPDGTQRLLGIPTIKPLCGERGLSHRERSRMLQASSVAGRTGAGAGFESIALLGNLPAAHLRADQARRPIPPGLACERMIPCPRAGCWKSARPVRRAGSGNGVR